MAGNPGAFAFLVKNDIAVQTSRWIGRKWFWLYSAVFAVLLLAVVTIWGGHEQFKPSYLLYLFFGFPYVFFGVAFGALKREWSGGTDGWWLTLPYSRTKLIGAKFMASGAAALALVVIYFVGILLLELYNQLIHGYDPAALHTFAKLEAEYLLLVVIAAPIMLSFGMFTVMVGRTPFRFLLPLVWVLFGTMGNSFAWLSSGSDDGEVQEVLLFDNTASHWLWLIVPAVYAVAALLFWANVGIVKRELTR